MNTAAEEEFKLHVEKAQRLLEKSLSGWFPEFQTLSISQAQEVFGCRSFDIWCAWQLLRGERNVIK